MNARLFWKRYRETDKEPRPKLRDIFFEWLVNNYLLDVIVMREDYETFRNRAADWVTEREKRIEEKKGKVAELERVIERLAKENQELRSLGMSRMGFDRVSFHSSIQKIPVYEIQPFRYGVGIQIDHNEITRVRYPIDRDWLRHIFRALSIKFAEQFREIVKKLPIDDAQKSETELHDEVFDPRVTDLEYFERRGRYHGLR